MKSIVARFLQFAFLMAALPAVFIACADPAAFPGSTTATVTVTLPAYPSEHPKLSGWLMVRHGAGPVYLAPGTQDVTVTLDKNQCTPILFYPLTGAGAAKGAGELHLRFFAPAGCVYPASAGASWQDGFASRLCLDLLTQVTPDMTSEQRRSFCNRFNWQRFSGEVAALEQTAAESEEGGELPSIDNPFNPWDLDRQKIITAICAGKFTKTTLKVSAKPVTLGAGDYSPLPEGTLFYQPYVLAPPLISAIDEAAVPTVTAPYRSEVSENILFDPNAGSVSLVYPAGKNYRLAILPLSHYTWGDDP